MNSSRLVSPDCEDGSRAVEDQCTPQRGATQSLQKAWEVVLDTAKHSETAEPEQIVAILNGKLPELGLRFARIGVLDVNGKATARGTATFVEYRGERFILTAQHVAERLIPNASFLFLPRRDSNGAILRTASEPLQVPLDISTTIESKALDVARIGLPDLPQEAGFFNVDSALEVKRNLLAAIESSRDSGVPFPFVLLGYPNSGHFTSSQNGVELTASVPLFAYLSNWVDAGMSSQAPQIHFEVDAPEPTRQMPHLTDFEQEVAERLFDPDSGNPFGGYSGGPAILLTPNEDHLIGTVKEGGFNFGSPRVQVTAIVDSLGDLAAT